MSKITAYGLLWNDSNDNLKIEFEMIRRGGKWMKDGKEYGRGLPYHYRRAQELMWPEDYHHRWSDLQLREILDNTITVILGPKDTGKTHVALVRYGLTDYFCFPNNTLIIVSSTDMRSLEGRVWGDMKSMFARAKERWEWLPGICLESKHAIVTDDLSKDAVIARDMRKGILCVPCKNSSGSFTGISTYVGMKQERRRHLGDEFQFMAPSMMDSIANMNSGDYKGVFVGNPLGQDDPLDKMSEPINGWDSMPEPTETTTWDNRRFLKSRTICLYGPDSPTFDTDDGTERYRGLINADGIARVVAGYGKDSHQYYSQCLGVRKAGLNARRVITRDLCLKHRAFEDLVWIGPVTKVSALDAAYGGTGGDRCVGGHIEFGATVAGGIKVKIHPPRIVPVKVSGDKSPEVQIAQWAKAYCESNGIPPRNFFYDSTGRGSLGPAFAREWSVDINPVEFGGAPTERPVSLDFSIYDEKLHTRRLKLCKEHYSKFVTELWWTVHYAIVSDQVRGMTEDLCSEGSAREWKEVAGSKIEIETKEDMRDRVGYSPDLFDWLVTAFEGARRLGFQISKLGSSDFETTDMEWFFELARKAKAVRQNHSLQRV